MQTERKKPEQCFSEGDRRELLDYHFARASVFRARKVYYCTPRPRFQCLSIRTVFYSLKCAKRKQLLVRFSKESTVLRCSSGERIFFRHWYSCRKNSAVCPCLLQNMDFLAKKDRAERAPFLRTNADISQFT